MHVFDINVRLTLLTISHNQTEYGVLYKRAECFIKDLSDFYRVPEVLHISCNTGGRALPDMSALALGRRVYISGNALLPVLQLIHIR